MLLSASPTLGRNELFSGLIVLGFLNGVFPRVVTSVWEQNALVALLTTLDVSVVVWASWCIVVSFTLRSPLDRVTRMDVAVAIAALIAFAIPVAPLSWVALSGIAVHMLRTSGPATLMRRGGWVLLALTVPMLWSRIIFSLFTSYILALDAALVGWIVGTERTGNTVAFADGSGYLWIAPGCSSLTNMSLAVLSWIALVQVFAPGCYLPRVWRWCVLACAGVVLVNVGRLSLIALYSERFELIHGPIGSFAASGLTVGLTLGVCALGVSRHLPTSR